MDCHRTAVNAELNLGQNVHDAIFLHNETFFATAQERYAYVVCVSSRMGGAGVGGAG